MVKKKEEKKNISSKSRDSMKKKKNKKQKTKTKKEKNKTKTKTKKERKKDFIKKVEIVASVTQFHHFLCYKNAFCITKCHFINFT